MAYTIGKLAKAAGVTLETIRYYQRKGLIEEPVKPLQGYRHYSEQTVQRLHFIKRAQQLGFTLKEINELLFLDSGHCDDVRQLAEQKLQQIEAQINSLTALHGALQDMVSGCGRAKADNRCSVIDALSQNGEK
ncbi:Hg(II)-responsive transcriptional regulator [methane-oxidizing endosymbiont of Gigantopelta aegis]|uniref:Hg(II)-responsive transcriptional regulator n=1 Tax=methane-oxidizing endosymbiont of Gigantopelta aegis TaxID=2794938 RepID=UPI0018DDD7D4|nr:Hg(II)-responsive transcriptional regulator [methane-oxidizing endosymbiont of Gigantopelta aegis]